MAEDKTEDSRAPRSDDLKRYIEYLQKQIMVEGTGDFFEGQTAEEWVSDTSNRTERFSNSKYFNGPAVSQYISDIAERFIAKTRFETPMTAALFGNTLAEVRSASETMFKPVRQIELLTATSSTCSPSAFPTNDIHLLFIGAGTASYCNYWAKAYTAVLHAISVASPHPIKSIEDMASVFDHNDSGLLLAGKLAIHYAFFNTALGFGRIDQSDDYLPTRNALLNSIETFVIAHEFAHFIAHEHFPQFSGSLSTDESKALESCCDEIGLSISRLAGMRSGNPYNFDGMGALAFYYSVKLCEDTRTLLKDLGMIPKELHGRPVRESSHPETAERILLIANALVDMSDPEDKVRIKSLVDEAAVIFGTVSFLVLAMLADGALQRDAEPHQ